MAAKKGNQFYVGFGLLAIGFFQLLVHLGVTAGFFKYLTPIILLIVGILVALGEKKGIVSILGWILAVFALIMLLIAFGVFTLAFMAKIAPIYWILLGLILLL